MMNFKFLQENKYNIEDDVMARLNVYENMAIGLISYCQRMNLNPVGYQHQFDESTSNNGPGHITRHLVLKSILGHNQFESRHVRIEYEIYDRNGINNYIFHLDEQIFETVIRRYENL